MDGYQGEKPEFCTQISVISAPSPWPTALHPAMIALRDSYDRNGYGFVAGRDVGQALGIVGLALEALVSAARDLTVDPYDATGMRCRRYGCAVYFPWARTLVPVPPYQDGPATVPYTAFLQTGEFNSEFGEVRRRFQPLTPSFLKNEALRDLVIGLFETIPKWRLDGSGLLPVLVGIHLIKLTAADNRSALSSPPHLHCDGEPTTFVTLLERQNVAGAVSYVAKRHCAGTHPDQITPADMLEKRVLTDPLDTLVVDDASVSHAVSGVRSLDGKPAFRTALLLDYSELNPAKSLPPEA